MSPGDQAKTKLLGIASLTACCLLGQAPVGPAMRTFTHERDVQTSSVWRHIPRWDFAMLVGYEGDDSDGPIIYTIDREGRRDEMLFTFEGASGIRINHVAGSRDGEIAVVGSALTNDGRLTAFLARISPDRKSQTITRTWPYIPRELTFDSDGNIWTVGNLKNEDNTRDVVSRHLLRRFDPAGKLLGSAIIRVRGSLTDESSFLRASRDRVGWFAGEEYVEFGMNGAEIGRYDGPAVAYWHDIAGVVISDENDVVAGRFGNSKGGILTLDRETRTWREVSLPKEYAPNWAFMLGFDGTTLVTYSDVGTLRRFETK